MLVPVDFRVVPNNRKHGYSNSLFVVEGICPKRVFQTWTRYMNFVPVIWWNFRSPKCPLHEDLNNWLLKNCNGQYDIDFFHGNVMFELSDDAVRFKLRFD